MSTLMRWIPVTESMPLNSEKVFITDGVDISCAHWFARFAPPDDNQPGEWVNQWERITGRWVSKPTHWMSIEDFMLWTLSNKAVELPEVDLKDVYDVEELDDVLDALTAAGVSHHILAGKKVIYHNDRKYPLVKHGNTIAIALRLHCEYCNVRSGTKYFKSGLHNGAFCYTFNKRGKYVANLRDQIYVCKSCLKKRTIRVKSEGNEE